MYLINFSGHPIKGADADPLVGVNLPLNDGDQLVAAIQREVRALPMFNELAAGQIAEIVLPGMAPAAAAVLAVWQGAFGSLPTIRYMVRGKEGFTFLPGTIIDLAVVRTAARTMRR